MNRNVPDKERQKLSAEIALLESLDVAQLRARWKIFYETEAPTRFSWLALGSQARREAVPGSDLDSAIADYTEALRLDPISQGAFLNRGIARRAMKIAAGICVFTNENVTIETLAAAPH